MTRMKKYVCLTLAVLLTAVFAAAAYSSNNTGSAEFAEGEVLVVMKSSSMASAAKSASYASTAATARVCASEAASLASTVSATSVQTYNALSASSGNVFAHLRSKTKTADGLIAELENDPRVLSVSKNYISRIAAVPDDTRWSEQWGPKKINAPTAWDTTAGSGDVVVAVLDTGVIYDHEDLADNMLSDDDGVYGVMFHDKGDSDDITGGGTSGASLASWDCVGDINGHGTHVAGIIGAVGDNGIGVAGVNWNVKILTVGVFSLDGDDVGAYDADVINGLNYIAGLKNDGVNIRVANISIGDMREPTPDNSVYGLAVKAASETGDTGILICMAAGNDKINMDYGERSYPSSFKFANTLSVGATNENDTKANYSNYSPSGKWVDVFAPGTGILSTCRSTDLKEYTKAHQVVDSSGYISINGTSMATPMVAGSAALLCAAYPKKTATEIKNLLISTATDVCRSGYSRYGQIDLGAAMALGNPVYVTSVTLNQASVSLTAGNTLQLTATVKPTNATKRTVTWLSSDADVAAVDQSGLVTAKAVGTAVITAEANDGSGKSASCSVTVTQQSGGGGGGGGCSAGVAGFALLFVLALPAVYGRKR